MYRPSNLKTVNILALEPKPIQHLCCMKNAEVIVAINRNPNALIIQVADFGIVVDMNEIISILEKRTQLK